VALAARKRRERERYRDARGQVLGVVAGALVRADGARGEPRGGRKRGLDEAGVKDDGLPEEAALDPAAAVGHGVEVGAGADKRARHSGRGRPQLSV
jgi:hypothetical protein